MRDVERRGYERRFVLAVRMRADTGRCSADVDRADNGNFRVLRGVGKVPDDEIGDIAVLLRQVRRGYCGTPDTLITHFAVRALVTQGALKLPLQTVVADTEQHSERRPCARLVS